MSHYEPDFFDTHDRKDYVCALGGWGALYCDPFTGDVVHYERGGDWEKPGDGYDNITRLDLEEWRQTYPKDDIRAGHDILDFGSWDTDGRYVEPEWDWRVNFWHERRDWHTLILGQAAGERFRAWFNQQEDRRVADQIDGYDRDDLGESPDY